MYEAPLDSLPDGTIVENDDAFWLVRGVGLHRWSFAGYWPRPPELGLPGRAHRPHPPLDRRHPPRRYTPRLHPSAV